MSPSLSVVLAIEWGVMFIREKKRRNQDGSVTVYLQLVENRRVDGKTRQRVLATLGRTDDPRLRAGLGSLVEIGRASCRERV